MVDEGDGSAGGQETGSDPTPLEPGPANTTTAFGKLRSAVSSILQFLFASSVARVSRFRYRKDDQEAKGSWIVFVFSGAATFAIGAAGLYIAFAELSGISVRSLSLPDDFVAAGYREEALLRQVVDNLPNTLGEWHARYTQQREATVSFTTPLQVGNERFCSPVQIGKIVDLDPTLFSADAVRHVRVEADLESSRLPFPGIETVMTAIRRMRGASYLVADLAVAREPDTGRFALKVQLNPVSGAETAAAPVSFTMPTLLAAGQDPGDLIGEALLRIATPEVASIMRGARATRTLDVETFMAEQYPSEERTGALKVARLATALSSPSEFMRWHNNNRALVLIGDMVRSEDEDTTRRVRPNQFELGWTNDTLYLSTLLYSGNNSPRTFEMAKAYHAASLDVFEKRTGRNARDIAHSPDPATRFARNLFPVVQQAVMGEATFAYEIEGVTRLREYVEESLAMAQPLSSQAQSDALDLIRGIAVSYMAMGYERARDHLVSATPHAEAARAELRALVDFYDVTITRPVNGRALFSASEENYLGTIAAAAQYLTGDRVDALRRMDRASANLGECALLGIAGEVQVLAQVSEESERADMYRRSFTLFEKAEASGLRNFGFYNSYGAVSQRAGEDAAALEAYSKALLYDGDHQWARSNAGWVHFANGNFADAERSFTAALQTSASLCRADREQWSDIDRKWDEQVAQNRRLAEEQGWQFAEPEVPDHPACQTAPAADSCLYLGAVRGELDSLYAQQDYPAFARAYRRYEHIFMCTTVEFNQQMGATYLRLLKEGYCAGRIDSFPVVPAALEQAVGMADGKPACEVAAEERTGEAASASE